MSVEFEVEDADDDKWNCVRPNENGKGENFNVIILGEIIE
jgi:hypothetical protein